MTAEKYAQTVPHHTVYGCPRLGEGPPYLTTHT